MKILYVVHQFFPRHFYGTERFTLDLATQIQRMGHYPIVVTHEPSADLEGFEPLTNEVLLKKYTYQTIPVIALKHDTPAKTATIFDSTLQSAFKELKISCDLMHITHPMRLSSIASEYKRIGTPILLTLTDTWLLCQRGLLDPGNRICNGPVVGEGCTDACYPFAKSRHDEVRALYNTVDEITTASRFVSEIFQRNGFNREITIIPHSVDYKNVRISNKQNPEIITFGFIGSLTPHKGVHILIKATRKIRECNIKVRIYGPRLKLYQNFVEIAEKDSRIQFLDSFDLKELPAVMEDISVLVVPSAYYEPYPLVILAALAYRKPVIASRIGGIPEVIKDGVNGFLFQMNNFSELAKIMKKIALAPEILESLKRNITSPRRLEEEALDYENIYRRLIASQGLGAN